MSLRSHGLARAARPQRTAPRRRGGCRSVTSLPRAGPSRASPPVKRRKTAAPTAVSGSEIALGGEQLVTGTIAAGQTERRRRARSSRPEALVADGADG